MLHQFLIKETDLTNLKSDADKLDIDKSKNVPTNLSNLESKLDKLDVEKLVLVLIDLSKLNDVVKKMMLLKKMYIMLRWKIFKIIPDITNLANNTSLNTKTNKVKGETPSISSIWLDY